VATPAGPAPPRRPVCAPRLCPVNVPQTAREIAMNNWKWKLILAGVVAAGVIGGIALTSARATPRSGVTATVLAGPVVLDEMHVGGETDDWEMEIKSKGLTDAHVVHQKVAPGGYSGWHSHPGPVFVLIPSGTATLYNATEWTVTEYPAGTGFVETAGHVDNLVNEGATDLEFIAIFLVPKGAPRRIDEPAP
jgi:quercetin dioxygenase-like cupin family protein